MKAKVLEHRVRYRDTDSTGRIFFSRYLEFFDDATIEFFRSIGVIFGPEGKMYVDGKEKSETFVVGSCESRFLGESFFDDVLEVKASVGELGEKKLKLCFECVNTTRGYTCAVGSMTFVCFNPSERKSARIPDSLMEKLSSLRAKEVSYERS